MRISGIEGLALTKLDVLAGLERVRICIGYRLAGEILDEMPVDAEDLAVAEPVYEDLDGWPTEAGVRRPAVGDQGGVALRRAGSRRWSEFPSGQPHGDRGARRRS